MNLPTRILFLLLVLLTTLGALFGPSLAIRPPEPERVPDGIETALLAAMDRGVPAEWVLQTAWLESRINETVVGSAGECGAFQLNPRWNPGVCELTAHDRALIAVELLAKYRREFKTWELTRLAYMSPVAARRKARV
jgi:hypothetical protein